GIPGMAALGAEKSHRGVPPAAGTDLVRAYPAARFHSDHEWNGIRFRRWRWGFEGTCGRIGWRVLGSVPEAGRYPQQANPACSGAIQSGDVRQGPETSRQNCIRWGLLVLQTSGD